MMEKGYSEEAVPVSKITMALEILDDGKWHGIDELLLSLELSENKFKELTSFLAAYSFVKFDEKHGRVKISREFMKLTQKLT
jgi:DNA-binding IclR family transcriptional regulator